jgi:hypothetical protein
MTWYQISGIAGGKIEFISVLTSCSYVSVNQELEATNCPSLCPKDGVCAFFLNVD